MDSDEFERLVSLIWEKQGWNTEITSGSTDRGVDVVAIKNDPFKQRQLIQAKCYGPNTKVGSKEIQMYSGLYQRDERVDAVVVATSNECTEEAKQVAQARDVKIIPGQELVELVSKYGIKNTKPQYSSSTVATGQGYKQSDEWRIKCPYCDSMIHNSTESFIEHWASSESCSFSIHNEKDTSVVGISWDEVVSRVKSRRKNIKKGSKSTGPPMDCPFCGTDLERSVPDYIEHLTSEACRLDSIDNIPEERPTKIPPEIWWELKNQLGVSGMYERNRQKSSTTTTSGQEATNTTNYEEEIDGKNPNFNKRLIYRIKQLFH
jgi:hypothetical protein